MKEITTKKVSDIKIVEEVEGLFHKPYNYLEIKEDIFKRGLQEPLLLSNNNELICGFTRFKIAKELGIKEVPCHKIKFNGVEEMARHAILDNIKRRQLSDLEIARACSKYIEIYENRRKVDIVSTFKGKTRDLMAEKICELTGVRMSGRKFERLQTIDSKLISELIMAYETGGIDQKEALKLTKYNPEFQKEVFEAWIKTPAMQKREKIAEEIEQIDEYLEKYPRFKKWKEAITEGDLGRRDEFLSAYTLKKEFAGQPRHYPKYSGWITNIIDDWIEKKIDKIPLFTQEEWEELKNLPDKKEIDYWNNLGIKLNDYHHEPLGMEILKRRTFDPDYGNFILEKKDGFSWECNYCFESIFVKKGWGEWVKVTFNDGWGRKISRRYFRHDHIGETLIKLASDTADPRNFSDDDYLNLKIHRLQESKGSWFYCRKETKKLDEAIKVLEEDLNRLREKKNLIPEEKDKRTLEWLAKYEIGLHARDQFREGGQTYKRLPGGGIDRKYMEDSHEKEMRKQR